MDTQKHLFVFIDNSMTPYQVNGVWFELILKNLSLQYRYTTKARMSMRYSELLDISWNGNDM